LLETRKDSTAIPAAAVQRGPQGTYVFVAKSNNTVEIRPVTLSFTQENTSVVASGVVPGDVVVTDGQDKLQEGSTIEIRAPRGSGGRTQQASENAPAGNETPGSQGSKASGQ
jgi:membrane fusion protein, multidrug efflux system